MQNRLLVPGIVTALAVAPAALAGVRVIHASPNTPAVDVYVNTVPGSGNPAIEDLAFTQGTGYVPLPTGTYDFRVTPANATTPVAISALGVGIDGNTDYTIAAIDSSTTSAPSCSWIIAHRTPMRPACGSCTLLLTCPQLTSAC